MRPGISLARTLQHLDVTVTRLEPSDATPSILTNLYEGLTMSTRVSVAAVAASDTGTTYKMRCQSSNARVLQARITSLSSNQHSVPREPTRTPGLELSTGSIVS